MRLNQNILTLVFFSTASLAMAAEPKLSNAQFTPGVYAIKSTTNADACVGGDFKITNNGRNIQLGSKHGFLLENKMDKTVATDDPEEQGCVYENSNSYTLNADSMIVSMKEDLRCDGAVKTSFVETAIIKPGTVHLEYKQTSGAKVTTQYSCDWELIAARGAASTKAPKKKK